MQTINIVVNSEITQIICILHLIVYLLISISYNEKKSIHISIFRNYRLFSKNNDCPSFIKYFTGEKCQKWYFEPNFQIQELHKSNDNINNHPVLHGSGKVESEIDQNTNWIWNERKLLLHFINEKIA